MARVSLRQLLDHAAEHGYGLPAFNISNMEQGRAIMMSKVCEQRFQEFGAAGRASGIKPVPLDIMAKRYAAGELAPTIRGAAR